MRNHVPMTAFMILCLAGACTDAAEGASAGEILRASGAKGGLCVHVGATDGVLTAGLAADGKFLVHGLAADAADLEKARAHVRAQGLCGKVSVERTSFAKLPYAEDLVNLLVVDDLSTARTKGLAMREVMRVLVPGGVAYVGTPDAAKFNEPVVRAWLAVGGVVKFEIVDRDGKWVKVVKPRPAGLDEWTHWRHDVDGNMVSNDTVVDVPRRVKWMVEPTWARSHIVQGGPRAMVSSGGRLFCIYDAAPRGLAGPMQLKLTARDAFNGLLLWEHDVKTRADFDFLKTEGQYSSYYWYQRRSLVAVGDRVYTVLDQDGPLLALDAATGEVLRTYDQVGSPNEVLYHDGKLVLAIHPAASGRWGPRIVCCIDAETGKPLWVKDKDRSRYVTLADGSVFYDAAKDIVRVNLATGEEQWRVKIPEGARVLCFHRDGRLFLKGLGKDLYAMSADDGRLLWTYPYKDFNGFYYSDTDVYFVGGLVWVQTGGERWAMVGVDPATGKEARRVDFPENYPRTRGHHRCHPNKATPRYFLLDTHGIDFIDWQARKVYDIRPIRGSCYYGILPANGLLYVPPNACQCGEYLRGFVAFSPSKVVPSVDDAATRFERGPAFGRVSADAPAPAPGDWSTFRHDPQRSGSTPTAVTAEPVPLWQRDVGGRLTAPTVADGTVFLARTDTHEVCAFDAETGEPRWRRTAGGPVDSPPTIHKGLALF
ncbi:MAG TPA: PQQ-binding-like beta-propeller repeat protein, partial [Planctomycetota bacterium]|nr:PQQ-binding-like beta-propeller repeat protein [Planctomycetota bacterium]